jgi:hypothetical protein
MTNMIARKMRNFAHIGTGENHAATIAKEIRKARRIASPRLLIFALS